MFRSHSSKSNDFKARAIFGSILMTVILMGYQNCGKVQKSSTVRGNRKITPLQSLSNVSAFTLVEQEVLNKDPNINPRDSSLNGPLIEWTIELDNNLIVKREFHPEDPLAAPVIVTCNLTNNSQRSGWQQTLHTLMESSQVCHFEIVQPPGTQCAAVIVNERHSEVQNYKLGYISSTCADYHDICDDAQRALYLSTLKDFITHYYTCN